MLYNWKTQTCSAGLSGMALIHPVKTLKNTILMPFWDSDSGILDNDLFPVQCISNPDIYFSIFFIVFEGYFKDVYENGIEEEQIPERVKLMVDDVDTVVMALANNLKGYKGYRK